MAKDNTVQKYERVISLDNMDGNSIDEAKILFKEYCRQNIILTASFDDDHWQCSDEYSYVGLVFRINNLSYRRYYRDYFSLSEDLFVKYLKAYVVLNLGSLSLRSMQNFVNDIKRLINYTPKQLFSLEKEIFFTLPNRVIEFLSTLPEPYDTEKFEKLLDILEMLADYHYSCINYDQRLLAPFDSYFLFNDILEDYWTSQITEKERQFYYPLYLWWKITGVIPLRPREFILTPRNCMEKKTDGWYITLRRNKIKGSNKKISYKIDDDYITVSYKIPNKLADEINKYIDYTKQYESTELNTLFVSDTHYIYWNNKKRSNSRYFTYINLNCVLRYFYHDIIKKKYGLKIIFDRELKHLEKGCINYLYLGDTRHLALINIIAEGGSPVLAMMLSGHENVNMSAHYYSNITSLIECRTYKQYRKVLKGNVQYELSTNYKSKLNVRDFVLLDDGGKCYSPNFLSGDFSECKKVAGPEGEIGYCPNCTYYRKNVGKSFFAGDDLYKRRIEEDCKHLEQIVRQVRIEKGNPEDILQAMLRLQNSSYTYQQYFEEKILVQREDENVTERNNNY